MRERLYESELVGKVVRIADRLLNLVIGLVLIVGLLYSGFGLWDTWNVYRNAGLDSDLLKYRPTVSADKQNPSLSELQAINPDICAWLRIDGTNIDYPVVHSQDNNMDYINANIYGEFSLSGSIFLDYRNQRDFSDYYSLVYGHHMAGDVMFGELPYFLEDEYFEEHATGTLFLPENTYDIQWFACVETDVNDEFVYLLITKEDEDSTGKMENLLNYLSQSARQYRDIGVTTSDHLIALSTCSESTTGGRTVLIGRINQ
jgi:sortase B